MSLQSSQPSKYSSTLLLTFLLHFSLLFLPLSHLSTQSLSHSLSGISYSFDTVLQTAAMAPRNSLTPIDADTVLKHGMPFVVKWRNPASNRLDFWIGVYVPDRHAFGVRKPKGTADADLEDQGKHLMYLPGRNTW